MATSNNQGSEAKREAKRLRSSEPDLKVVLGSGDKKVTKWYHSTMLASKSKYIDAMLAAPMKEQEESTISFPDIESDVWDDMMKFVDCPVAARRMNEVDALRVAKLYDKYEFKDGSVLCDVVLNDYFKSAKQQEQNLTLDVNIVVDSVIVAQEANLMNTLRRSLKYCWEKMHESDVPYGRTMFTEDHLKKLTPVLSTCLTPENIERIGAGASWFHGGIYDFSGTIRHFDLKLNDPTFPTAFVKASAQRLEESLLHRCIQEIEVSGAGQADGIYHKMDYETMSEYRCYGYERRRQTTWGGKMMSFVIKKCWEEKTQGWAIMRQYTLPRNQRAAQNNDDDESDEEERDRVVENVCWVAPCSTTVHFPPLNNWKPVDPLARSGPKISYILRDEIS